MTTETEEVIVQEFLRPENSCEPVPYDVAPHIADKIKQIQAKSLDVCCDVYTNGFCRVYIYRPLDDCTLALSQRASYAVADSLLELFIEDFDLRTLM